MKIVYVLDGLVFSGLLALVRFLRASGFLPLDCHGLRIPCGTSQSKAKESTLIVLRNRGLYLLYIEISETSSRSWELITPMRKPMFPCSVNRGTTLLLTYRQQGFAHNWRLFLSTFERRGDNCLFEVYTFLTLKLTRKRAAWKRYLVLSVFTFGFLNQNHPVSISTYK